MNLNLRIDIQSEHRDVLPNRQLYSRYKEISYPVLKQRTNHFNHFRRFTTESLLCVTNKGTPCSAWIGMKTIVPYHTGKSYKEILATKEQ